MVKIIIIIFSQFNTNKKKKHFKVETKILGENLLTY